MKVSCRHQLGFALVALMSTQPANAQRLSVERAAAVFGARPGVLNISLSPDGTRLAVVGPNGPRGAIVDVIDVANPSGGSSGIMGSTGDPDKLEWCRWAGNARLLCNGEGSTPLPGGGVTTTNRIFAVDANGKNVQMLRQPNQGSIAYGSNYFGGQVIDWNPGKEGHVLMARRYYPESTVGSLTAKAADGLAVDDIDSSNLKSTTIEKAKLRAVEYISDGLGTVRIYGLDIGMKDSGYSSSKIKYSYRATGKDGWQELSQYDSQTETGFEPWFVDPKLNIAYGLDKLNGRRAAYSVALDGSGKQTLLFERPDVDISGFSTIGRNRRVIGATFATDVGQVLYFDPEIKKLAIGLSKALPKAPLVRFIDSSQDERKLLLFAGSDNDPGRYFLLNRDTNGLTELAFSRPDLEKVQLAQVRHITYPARDGTPIPAYLTLPPGSDGKNLPAIVLPHGGPSARDVWGFDWLSQFWAHLGYAVLQPNFRGSAGYGDAWFKVNGFQGWRTAIGDIADAGRWMTKQGIANPSKLAIFGWSYGGYAALQAAVTEPDLFKAVVAIAPVTDLGKLKSDAINFSDRFVTEKAVGNGAHVEEGSPARHAAEIKAPVLMFHGTYDENVPIGQSRLMADRLRDAGKPSRLVVYDKLDHYLEDSAVRKDMLLQSARFMEQSFGGAK